MNCVQALAVAAAALTTAGLPIEAQMTQARCLIRTAEAQSHKVLHATTEAFSDRFQHARAAPEGKLTRAEFAYAPDRWIHSAMRHPL